MSLSNYHDLYFKIEKIKSIEFLMPKINYQTFDKRRTIETHTTYTNLFINKTTGKEESIIEFR